MAKSKRRHKGKQKRKRTGKRRSSSARSTRAHKSAPAVQLRAFEIVDDVGGNYKPGITDEIGEATRLFKIGRIDEAQVAFQRVIEREPQAKEAYANLAAVYVQMGDDDTAETIFEETVDKFPTWISWGVGEASALLGRTAASWKTEWEAFAAGNC